MAVLLCGLLYYPVRKYTMKLVKDLSNESRQLFSGNTTIQPGTHNLEGLSLLNYNESIGCPASVFFDENGYLDVSMLSKYGLSFFTPFLTKDLIVVRHGYFSMNTPVWTIKESFDESFLDFFSFYQKEVEFIYNTHPKLDDSGLIEYRTYTGKRYKATPYVWFSKVCKRKERLGQFERAISTIVWHRKMSEK